jgi:hypothetical protein
MRTLRHLIAASAALAAISAAPAAGADMEVEDLRVGGGVLSKVFTGGEAYSATDSGGTVTTTSVENPNGTDARRNYRAEVSYIGGRLYTGGGLLGGIDVALNQARFEASGAEVVDNTPVADLQLGYGIAPLPNWHFELMAIGGFGWTYERLTGSGITSTHVHTHYLEYGGRIGTYYAIGGRLVLGLEVPYLVGDFHPSVTTSDSSGDHITASDRLRNRGFGVLAQVGVRL